MELLDKVRQTVQRYHLAHPGSRVVVALSGGPDSVGLAYLARELDRSGELRLVGLGHLNHQLRANAERDERFCGRVADALGYPLFVECEDVAARARRERRSMEDAARTARYEFFERARRRFDADCVAVAHTRDDQAETVLLRLLRGAGVKGLAGMHPRRDRVVRPLLECRRAEILAYLDEHAIASVRDESNEDVAIPRNRVRVELMPLLERRFNPAVVDLLADQATLARETWQWVERAADELVQASRLDSAEPAAVVLDLTRLAQAPIGLRRAALWRAMSCASGGRPVSFTHVDRAVRLLESAADRGGFDAPGHRVERRGPRLVLRSRAAGEARTEGRPVNLFRYPLSIPGEVPVPEAACIVSAERACPGGAPDVAGAGVGNGPVAVVRDGIWEGPLAVRNRRPGDRFRPVGLRGWKKLQDLFVDRKLARERRDTVPLVVDGADRILWVAGYGIDEAFRVTDASQGMLILRLRPA
jgi:tRNA(Ile)-lysidine synthase